MNISIKIILYLSFFVRLNSFCSIYSNYFTYSNFTRKTSRPSRTNVTLFSSWPSMSYFSL